MTVDPSKAETAAVISAAVTIRVSRLGWVWPLVYGGLLLVFAVSWLSLGRPLFALCWLVLGAVTVAQGLWMRTFGMELTPECAVLRGVRRRAVPWHQVQAVVHHRRQGAWGVRLILENGTPVMLRAPTTYWGIGVSAYERDFDRIGQWWLAHRGESWRPLRSEAPPLPARG
jgi:hypothetical protein